MCAKAKALRLPWVFLTSSKAAGLSWVEVGGLWLVNEDAINDELNEVAVVFRLQSVGDVEMSTPKARAGNHWPH